MKLFVFIFIITSASFVNAETKTYGDATARYVSVYDGDTIFVDIYNWPAIIGNRIGIRINGIDTPEKTAKDPKIKRLALESRMFVVNALKDSKEIELRNIKRGKYFRIAADVYIDGNNLSDLLINEKLAKKYDGTGKRPKWSIEDYNNYFGETNASPTN